MEGHPRLHLIDEVAFRGQAEQFASGRAVDVDGSDIGLEPALGEFPGELVGESSMKKIADGEAYAGVCIYSLGVELAKKYPVSILR